MSREYAAAVPFRAEAVAPHPARAISVTVWLGIVLFVCLTYFAPHTDADESARFDMTVALVNHATFQIDRYVGNTIDDDHFQGHYYSIKAPGQAFLGVPAYLAYKGISALQGHPAPDDANDLAAKTFVVAITDALPMTFFLLLFFWFLGYFSGSLAHRAILTLALGLGTPIFPYAQNFYAHALVAGLLFAAFVLVYVLNRGAVRGKGTRWFVEHPRSTALLTGLALGMAVLEEFPAALLACIIGLYALFHLPRRLWPYLIAAGIPPLLVVLGYDTAIYHSPFTVPYTSGASVQFQQQLGVGIAGFTWPPKSEAIVGMSVSPYRGIFFLSPFLLLAFPGYVLWARRGGWEWVLFLAIPVIYFCTLAMYSVWWGGYAVGPRHLIPMLPFLAFPAIFTLDRFLTPGRLVIGYEIVAALIIWSIGAIWAETITWPPGVPAITLWPSDSNHNPLFTQYLPALFSGNMAANQGTMHFGLSGQASLIPLCIALAGLSIWILGMHALARWISD